MPQVTSVLVANRGEIARRIFATCRRAGIATVAVFSDADAGSPHAAEADRAVRLPGTGAGPTYLNGPALVAAARAAGADAVHPGYGFLAEDPAFARLVTGAGLTWIGPPPAAMQAMSRKLEARAVAAAAGLPVLPELDPAAVSEFPVLVKASAGGGGRGIRAVHGPEGLAEAAEAARREAQAAFGDGTVFCEPLLTGAHHVEVQVLADAAGTVWALTERDCSVQRRFAKVVEESPSPVVGPGLRERLHRAAAELARAVGYQSAGTVEFLVDPATGSFFFLEFNTRLQVEHPVTECVHGIDLVALQIAVAEGMALPTEPPPAAGHAIEARLYAEDPADGFRPATGIVRRLEIPGVNGRFGPPAPRRDHALGPAAAGEWWRLAAPFLRLDSGVEPGTEVTSHYDAMLAKVIAWAGDRAGALRRLAAALSGARIAGPATNRDLLVAVLGDHAFREGRADTALLAGWDLAALRPGRRACALSAAAASAAIAAANRESASVARAVPGGFRNVWSQPQLTAFDGPAGRIEVAYRWTRAGGIELVGITDGERAGEEGRARGGEAGGACGGAAPGRAAVTGFSPGTVTLEADGVRYRFEVTREENDAWVHSPLGSVRLTVLDRLPAAAAAAEPGSLRAPMPGGVARIGALAGDRVAAGQVVVVLEAMKMEHQVTAPAAGVLTEVRVSPGAQVEAGDVLAVISPDGGPG